MATSTVPAVLDALRTALDARPGLDGVSIFTGPAGDEAGLESIEFFDVEDWSLEFANLGGSKRDEEYSLQGFVWIVKPGAGETTIKAARDRAIAIYIEIESQLRTDPKVGERLLWALPNTARLTQRMSDKGRVAILEFTVRCKARI